jgi:hypothetical protein
MAEMFNFEGRLGQDRRQDMQGEVASVQPRVEASALLDPFRAAFGFRIYGSCRCGRGLAFVGAHARACSRFVALAPFPKRGWASTA